MPSGNVTFTKRKEISLSLWIIALMYFVAAALAFAAPLFVIVSLFVNSPSGQGLAVIVLFVSGLIVPLTVVTVFGALCIFVGKGLLEGTKWSLIAARVLALLGLFLFLFVAPVFLPLVFAKSRSIGILITSVMAVVVILIGWVVRNLFRKEVKQSSN